jgi:hypothetical protein
MDPRVASLAKGSFYFPIFDFLRRGPHRFQQLVKPKRHLDQALGLLRLGPA